MCKLFFDTGRSAFKTKDFTKQLKKRPFPCRMQRRIVFSGDILLSTALNYPLCLLFQLRYIIRHHFHQKSKNFKVALNFFMRIRNLPFMKRTIK
jgi:hypothetical protein